MTCWQKAHQAEIAALTDRRQTIIIVLLACFMGAGAGFMLGLNAYERGTAIHPECETRAC